jgi:phosphotransferase system HPr-like phosphotransfer protein
LRAELAQKAKEADAQIAQSKQGVLEAIDRIRQSEEILNQALDAESAAHQTAARSALTARDEIARTLAETTRQIDDITAKLKDGLKVTLNADTARFDQAIADLDKALAEKQYLLQIQADLQEAEKKLKEYEQLLKEGKTLPVDADVSKAKEALDRLKTYADQNAQFELKVATEKAQAAITNVETMIRALDRIQTESRHQVASNVDAVRAEIDSLNGRNTSSTHTIYVQKVEVNATGGLVGGGQSGSVRRFADGGAVTPAFPRMTGGTVPGSGHNDTVPRTLDAGAFVIRKAAVRKYGSGTLARLANMARAGARSLGLAAFARGGLVEINHQEYDTRSAPAQKLLRDIDDAKRVILYLQGQAELAQAELDRLMEPLKRPGWRMDWRDYQSLIAQQNRKLAEKAQYERQAAEKTAHIKMWMADLQRYRLRQYARGGAASDTVPAMLTPGEFVVNRDAVARYGAGFFEAINNLSAPARLLADRVLAGVQGFASGGLVQPVGSGLTRPVLPAEGGPTRTVRVELSSGDRKVNATVDARDEARLLQLLDAARARAV